MRRPQIDAMDRKKIVVLPVAAVEQHGPHLPLDTDCVIGEAIAARLDEALKGQMLILPTQAVGCSEHHMAFAGSLTLEHESFRRTVIDTVRSVIRHGFGRVLILNSHGGNHAINAVIGEQLGQQFPEAQIVVANWWSPAVKALAEIREGALGSVGHACEFETSLMLALEPDMVDMDSAIDDGKLHRVEAMRLDMLHAPAASQYRPFHQQTTHGVYGTPSLASAEKGQRVLEAVVESLRALLVELWPDMP